MNSHFPTTPTIVDRIESLEKHLRRIARQFAQDEHEAQDIYQVIVEKMLEHSDPASSNSMLLTFAKWKAIAYLKVNATYNKHVGVEEELATGNKGDGTDEVFSDSYENVWETYVDNEQSVEDIVVQNEEFEMLREVIRSLPPENQQIIRMIACGESRADIARTLGVSRAAITQRVSAISAVVSPMNLFG